MRKIVFGTSLFIACISVGCTSTQLHQSLLLHENRQLEDALYVAQAQVTDLRRENDWLRDQQENVYPAPAKRLRGEPWNDIVPTIEMPKMILDEESGTTEVPMLLRGSQSIPLWTPVR
jgi:hypothetical protein